MHLVHNMFTCVGSTEADQRKFRREGGGGKRRVKEWLKKEEEREEEVNEGEEEEEEGLQKYYKKDVWLNVAGSKPWLRTVWNNCKLVNIMSHKEQQSTLLTCILLETLTYCVFEKVMIIMNWGKWVLWLFYWASVELMWVDWTPTKRPLLRLSTNSRHQGQPKNLSRCLKVSSSFSLILMKYCHAYDYAVQRIDLSNRIVSVSGAHRIAGCG